MFHASPRRGRLEESGNVKAGKETGSLPPPNEVGAVGKGGATK